MSTPSPRFDAAPAPDDVRVDVAIRPTAALGAGVAGSDHVAVEEPLTIRLAAGDGETTDLAVTMRTPGHDDELAVGWLRAEGVVSTRRDVVDVAPCAVDLDDDARGNVLQVTLRSHRLPDLDRLDRHGLVTSACGVCGRRSLDALAGSGVAPVGFEDLEVAESLVRDMPSILRTHQPAFGITGGTHAAALVAPDRRVVVVREDVGRHNAVDKVVGARMLDGLPTDGHVLGLSGRASYELLAKAAVARVPVVVANGAASSLAVDVARRFDITLVAFAVTDDPTVFGGRNRVSNLPAEGPGHGNRGPTRRVGTSDAAGGVAR